MIFCKLFFRLLLHFYSDYKKQTSHRNKINNVTSVNNSSCNRSKMRVCRNKTQKSNNARRQKNQKRINHRQNNTDNKSCKESDNLIFSNTGSKNSNGCITGCKQNGTQKTTSNWTIIRRAKLYRTKLEQSSQ